MTCSHLHTFKAYHQLHKINIEIILLGYKSFCAFSNAETNDDRHPRQGDNVSIETQYENGHGYQVIIIPMIDDDKDKMRGVKTR